MNSYYEEAHKKTVHSRSEIEKSNKCGCFYCLQVFDPEYIQVWSDNNDTPICPHCYIDSVIGDAQGYPATDIEFLKEMNKIFFRKEL